MNRCRRYSKPSNPTGRITDVEGRKGVIVSVVLGRDLAPLPGAFDLALLQMRDGDPRARRHRQDGGGLAATFSDIQGGWPGVGNIDADPLFVRDPDPGPGQAITSTLSSPTHTYTLPGVYTVTLTVSGVGSTGPHLGDHVWPAMNNVMMAVVDGERKPEILERVRRLQEDFPFTGLRAVVLPVLDMA